MVCGAYSEQPWDPGGVRVCACFHRRDADSLVERCRRLVVSGSSDSGTLFERELEKA